MTYPRTLDIRKKDIFASQIVDNQQQTTPSHPTCVPAVASHTIPCSTILDILYRWCCMVSGVPRPTVNREIQNTKQ